jgi:hypothetical protein
VNVSRDDLKEMPTYNYYYYTPHEHSSGESGLCVYSDEFFIFAGDICDELSKTNAPFSAPTLIGSTDDMTAPSFANQIHMTTGEDRRRSTHTHAQTSSSGNHLANPG